MGNLCVEIRGKFATLSGEGRDNQTALTGLVHFLLSIQSAAIMNEISRVVISGEGFVYSFSFHGTCLGKALASAAYPPKWWFR